MPKLTNLPEYKKYKDKEYKDPVFKPGTIGSFPGIEDVTISHKFHNFRSLICSQHTDTSSGSKEFNISKCVPRYDPLGQQAVIHISCAFYCISAGYVVVAPSQL